jgi:hypothetical protein
MKSKKKAENEEPVLLWTTFCRNVLTEQATGEISLVGLLPNIRITVQKIAKTPEQIQIPLGSIYVHAIFKRDSKMTESPLELTLGVQLHFPGQSSDSTVPLKIEGKVGQLAMKFMNPVLSLKSTPGITEHLAFIEWHLQEKKLGRAELPIEIIIKDIGEQ